MPNPKSTVIFFYRDLGRNDTSMRNMEQQINALKGFSILLDLKLKKQVKARAFETIHTTLDMISPGVENTFTEEEENDYYKFINLKTLRVAQIMALNLHEKLSIEEQKEVEVFNNIRAELTERQERFATGLDKIIKVCARRENALIYKFLFTLEEITNPVVKAKIVSERKKLCLIRFMEIAYKHIEQAFRRLKLQCFQSEKSEEEYNKKILKLDFVVRKFLQVRPPLTLKKALWRWFLSEAGERYMKPMSDHLVLYCKINKDTAGWRMFKQVKKPPVKVTKVLKRITYIIFAKTKEALQKRLHYAWQMLKTVSSRGQKYAIAKRIVLMARMRKTLAFQMWKYETNHLRDQEDVQKRLLNRIQSRIGQITQVYRKTNTVPSKKRAQDIYRYFYRLVTRTHKQVWSYFAQSLHEGRDRKKNVVMQFYNLSSLTHKKRTYSRWFKHAQQLKLIGEISMLNKSFEIIREGLKSIYDIAFGYQNNKTVLQKCYRRLEETGRTNMRRLLRIWMENTRSLNSLIQSRYTSKNQKAISFFKVLSRFISSYRQKKLKFTVNQFHKSSTHVRLQKSYFSRLIVAQTRVTKTVFRRLRLLPRQKYLQTQQSNPNALPFYNRLVGLVSKAAKKSFASFLSDFREGTRLKRQYSGYYVLNIQNKIRNVYRRWLEVTKNRLSNQRHKGVIIGFTSLNDALRNIVANGLAGSDETRKRQKAIVRMVLVRQDLLRQAFTQWWLSKKLIIVQTSHEDRQKMKTLKQLQRSLKPFNPNKIIKELLQKFRRNSVLLGKKQGFFLKIIKAQHWKILLVFAKLRCLPVRKQTEKSKGYLFIKRLMDIIHRQQAKAFNIFRDQRRLGIDVKSRSATLVVESVKKRAKGCLSRWHFKTQKMKSSLISHKTSLLFESMQSIYQRHMNLLLVGRKFSANETQILNRVLVRIVLKTNKRISSSIQSWLSQVEISKMIRPWFKNAFWIFRENPQVKIMRLKNMFSTLARLHNRQIYETFNKIQVASKQPRVNLKNSSIQEKYQRIKMVSFKIGLSILDRLISRRIEINLRQSLLSLNPKEKVKAFYTELANGQSGDSLLLVRKMGAVVQMGHVIEKMEMRASGNAFKRMCKLIQQRTNSLE